MSLHLQIKNYLTWATSTRATELETTSMTGKSCVHYSSLSLSVPAHNIHPKYTKHLHTCWSSDLVSMVWWEGTREIQSRSTSVKYCSTLFYQQHTLRMVSEEQLHSFPKQHLVPLPLKIEDVQCMHLHHVYFFYCKIHTMNPKHSCLWTCWDLETSFDFFVAKLHAMICHRTKPTQPKKYCLS